MNRLFTTLRRPVKRQGAEHYVLITLLSFAASVTLTRLFLELTGYPQLGQGVLHIAHLMWGGLFLFVAALLPLVIANRWVYTLSALLGGIGVGLFIDEVGKFITQENDYFFPPAAPIIYAFFLLTVLLYLRIRRPSSTNPRAELYHILDALEDVLDHDLDPEELADIRSRLTGVIQTADHPDLKNLARELLEFLESDGIHLVPGPPNYWLKIQARLYTFEQRYITQDRFRAILAGGIAAVGLVALSKLGQLLIVTFAPASLAQTLAAMISVGILERPTAINWFIARVVLEGVVGLLLFFSAILLAIGKDRPGVWLSYTSLLLALTTVDLFLFYFEQFSTILTALFQFTLFLGLIIYRKRFLSHEDMNTELSGH